MEVVNRPPQRDEVWLVSLDPTHGAEIQKTRPCLIIAPMTTAVRFYPTRVPVRFQRKSGQVVLDQLRAIDRQRLLRKLGTVSASTAREVSTTLLEMFSRS